MRHATPAPLDDAEAAPRDVRIRADLLVGLPDTRSPEYIAETRRQLKLLSESPQAAEDQAFVDAISIDFDELD